MTVIGARGELMAGVSRLHEPEPSGPLHVLVIDELAVLTSYGPAEIVKETSRLSTEILTQGRALGVVVLAAVQDPRKEVVAMCKPAHPSTRAPTQQFDRDAHGAR